MPVPAAKVKEVCTVQEAELVRSSRRPALSKLTPAQLKQSATRARKHYDKWLALSREQARAKSKKLGIGESKANTKLKLDIFGDALKSFDAALAKQEPQSTPKNKAKTKKTRNAGHRATRAEVRAKLRSKMDKGDDSPTGSVKKKAKKKVAKKKTATKTPKKVAKKKPKKSVKKTSPASQPTSNPGLTANKKKRRQAKTAAKKARIDRSGLTSRVAGHVSARDKRAQASRDSRG